MDQADNLERSYNPMTRTLAKPSGPLAQLPVLQQASSDAFPRRPKSYFPSAHLRHLCLP